MPIRQTNHDCFQSCLVSLANYWRRDCTFLFADSWGFKYKYDDPKSAFGDRIDTDHYHRFSKLLSNYHGINCYWNENIKIRDVFCIFHKELKRMPILLVIDSYWCHWLKDYKKNSIQHYCIILGIEEDTQNIICLDPYSSAKKKYLKYEDLERGYIKFMTFSLNKPVELKNIDLKFVLLNYVLKCLDINNGESSFENMVRFAKDLRNSFDIQNEFQRYDNIEYVLLLFKLKLIENGRRNTALFLEFIKINYNYKGLDIYFDRLHEISKKWSNVRLFIMKQSYTKAASVDNEKIFQQIMEIMETEKIVALDLKEWLSINV